MTRLRVATYNVNSVRARLPLLSNWIQAQHPDVVCLQETKVRDDEFPSETLRSLGYHAVFRGEGGYNGVAVLSLETPTAARFGLDSEPPDGARLAAVEVRGVAIVNSYVPQGRSIDDPMFRYKLRWFERLRSDFDRRYAPEMPVLWIGDFNVAPEPIDVHDPKRLVNHVCYHVDARRALAAAKAWGFEDVFRIHHPNEPGQYTFYDYRAKNSLERGTGWRVDHIWATRPLAARSTGAWIDLAPRRAARPSDHTPLIAEFDL